MKLRELKKIGVLSLAVTITFPVTTAAAPAKDQVQTEIAVQQEAGASAGIGETEQQENAGQEQNQKQPEGSQEDSVQKPVHEEGQNPGNEEAGAAEEQEKPEASETGNQQGAGQESQGSEGEADKETGNTQKEAEEDSAKEEQTPGEEGEGVQQKPQENPEEGNPAEAEKEQKPEEQLPPETPEEYEARTGYSLPEGCHYVLDENGCVILLEGGAPQVEYDSPEAPESNEELVERQEIVEKPEIKEDFRFWTVARRYGFSKDRLLVREEMSETSRGVGELRRRGVCYILKEEENGWLYVESGSVRGFVQKDEILTGEDAQSILESYQRKARAIAKREGTEYTGIDQVVCKAEPLIEKEENQAYLYLRATVEQTVVEKQYALSREEALPIYEERTTESRAIGTLPLDGLCYLLAETDGWVFVESGDVRGFVQKDCLEIGEGAKQRVSEAGEEQFSLAEQLVEPKENKACYYTLTSVKSGVPAGTVRNSLVEFASRFIGNPYVWGGTSLTEGADCSGFVQSVFREYGYELPRVAEDQAQCGVQIPVEEAQPGDLVFYAKDGYIYHVVIYAGDGKTVEAMGTNYGIVEGNLNTDAAVWACRILDDTDNSYTSGDIWEVNAGEDRYGENLGNFKITYYCSCELCCDVETGITATGTPVVEGRTIAVDPSVIPYGTQVIINGHVFTAEDCGGAIKENRIDIYVSDHARANELGVDYADVYLAK